MNQKLVLGLVAAWLLIFLAFAGFEQYTLSTGTEVLLKHIGPDSPFKGGAVSFSYDISYLDLAAIPAPQLTAGQSVYVILEPGEKYWHAKSIEKKRLPNTVSLKGKVTGIYEAVAAITYGIESYALSRLPQNKLNSTDVSVVVAVDSFGNSVIKQILIDDQPAVFAK